MRILYICHDSSLYGAQRCFLETAEVLCQSNYVLCVLPYHGQLAVELERKKIQFIINKTPWWVGYNNLNFKAKLILLKNIIASIPFYCRLIKKNKIDLVITNSTVISPSPAVAAYIKKRKHIWYIHEFGKEDHNLYYYFSEKLTYKFISYFSNRIWVNSNILRNKLLKYSKEEKIDILDYVVDVDTKYCPGIINDYEPPLKIIIYGAISESKGQHLAIKALSLLPEYKNMIRLLIMGDSQGNYSQKLQELIESLNLESQIAIVGFSDNPLEIVSKYHIVLMCSKFEAFGRVTIEAMKLGKPVIGSNSGATSELVIENYNGLLFEAGNSLDLANKLKYLMNNKNKLNELSSNALEWSHNKFNKQQHFNKMNQYIQKTIN